jgi:hypothetical protein
MEVRDQRTRHKKKELNYVGCSTASLREKKLQYEVLFCAYVTQIVCVFNFVVMRGDAAWAWRVRITKVHGDEMLQRVRTLRYARIKTAT